MATGEARGRHAGARRAERPPAPRGQRARSAALVLGMLAAVVAWGFLVWSAIDFGRDARGGDTGAWWFLAIASIGAIGCLFLALVLGARGLRRWGLTRDPDGPERPAGGRRIKR